MGQKGKMGQILATFWRSINFKGRSELNRLSEGPIKGAKMNVTDLLELIDINGCSHQELTNRVGRLVLYPHRS